VIALNRNKTALFSPEERLILLSKLVSPWDNVVIDLHDGLIVDYAKKTGITVFIRGIRNIQDFMYEFDISLINKALESKIETVFIPTEQRFFVLNSSVIKEVAAFGGDTSSMAPAIVVEALKKKFAAQQKNR
jgi:pantetheine-phosphate adenylyltransferase